MLSNTFTKLLDLLPNKLLKVISVKIVNHYLKKYASLDITGSENLQVVKKPVIFICNHLSNADGLILSKVLREVDPTFVAGVKLANNAVTSIGMNVVKTTSITPNSVDTKSLKQIIQLVKQGESILIFPEGTRSRVGSMIEAKKGILLIAKMTKAPIVPIGIYGTEKLLPINPEGKMSSEKFNYAETYVNIGHPFRLPAKEEVQNKKAYDAYLLDYMMRKISDLLPVAYRGIYK